MPVFTPTSSSRPAHAPADAPALKPRDHTIDLLRGLAVVTMIAANLSARALAEPHPLWFRAYGSFAAPLFVLLAGMMIEKTATEKQRGFRFFLTRGLLLVAGGVLVDVAFERIYPFTSMDVLYLLGVALPLGFLGLRLPASVRWGLVIAIFAAAPLLQHTLGYTEYPTEFELNGKLVEEAAEADAHTSIGNHVLIDGWFPLVPWFGFALLGINLAHMRWDRQQTRSFGTVKTLATGAFLLGAGVALMMIDPGPLLTRGGYSELFYPPTIGYLVVACGVILLLFWAADATPRLRILEPLRVLGQTALFTYLLHRAVIALVFADRYRQNTMTSFLLLYAGLLVFCLASAYGLRWGRRFVREALE